MVEEGGLVNSDENSHIKTVPSNELCKPGALGVGMVRPTLHCPSHREPKAKDVHSFRALSVCGQWPQGQTPVTLCDGNKHLQVLPLLLVQGVGVG